MIKRNFILSSSRSLGIVPCVAHFSSSNTDEEIQIHILQMKIQGPEICISLRTLRPLRGIVFC